jgi:hypothetical protein
MEQKQFILDNIFFYPDEWGDATPLDLAMEVFDMNRSRLYPAAALACLVVLAMLSASGTQPKAEKAKDEAAVTLFGADPAHPWNRLYQVLYVPIENEIGGSECRGTAARRQEPFLLQKAAYDKALGTLDAFLKAKDDERVEDPVKRALLQRDLWYVFDTLGEIPYPGERGMFGEPTQRRRAIQKRLAQLMRRLEQPASRLKELPDAYGLTVKKGVYPTKFDAEHPERPYLPADLRLDDKSDWVIVRAASTALSAPEHNRFVEGKSVFLTLLRLPGARKKTEDYLADMPEDRGKKGFQPLPDGSQVALVRRMLLPDDKGELQPTPLIEDVQLRIFSKRREQHAFEFTLDRGGLLSGRNALWARDDPSVRRSCQACHKPQDGVFSLSTFGLNRLEGYHGAARTNLTEQVDGTINLKKQSYSWGLLQGLRETTP